MNVRGIWCKTKGLNTNLLNYNNCAMHICGVYIVYTHIQVMFDRDPTFVSC